MRMAGAPPRARGFTLLELLVVLTLIGLAVGLVAPSMVRWLGGAQERGWRADLRARIESLPVRAFIGGEALALDGPALLRDLPGLPSDVTLELDSPLRYSELGVALGGALEIQQGRRRDRWRIAPVTGEVIAAEPAP
jgi:prepilin-type N-terminal cleavage/methylation domain-containing protein